MSTISWQASFFVSLDFSNMLSFLFFCRITFIILSLECILLSSVSQAWLTSDLVFPLSAHFEQRYMPSAPLMLAPGFLQHKICISTCICYDIPMYMCICMLFLFSPLPSLILRLGINSVVSFARQLYLGWCTFLYFLSPRKILSLKSLLSLNSALPSFSDCPHHRQSRCPLCPRALAPIFPNPSQRIFLLDFALFEFEFIFSL